MGWEDRELFELTSVVVVFKQLKKKKHSGSVILLKSLSRPKAALSMALQDAPFIE